MNNILVTGGCGFIGTNFIKYVFNTTGYIGNLVNVDALTYASNPRGLDDIKKKYSNRYTFIHEDIRAMSSIKNIINKYNIDTIVHFAAESHVDNSIKDPAIFITTNVLGTFNLLEIVKEWKQDGKDLRFHHISTDEVYGSLGTTGMFTEESPYKPRSPYSASKAASDHLVNSYFTTYNIPVTLSNCSNNYGPHQNFEKFIVIIVNHILNGTNIPVYGNGKNIRDWLYVEDHCSAIWTILENGKLGENYNIGGGEELSNIYLVNLLCELVANKFGKQKDYFKHLITFVNDRPGHDFRYAIDSSKIKKELGWSAKIPFKFGIDITLDWIIKNRDKHINKGV